MDTHSPEFQISLKFILPTAAVLAAAASFIAFSVFKTRRQKHLSGTEALVGEFAEVRETVDKKGGKVFIQGELWNAITESSAEIPKGAVVVVKEVRRLQLVVQAQS